MDGKCERFVKSLISVIQIAFGIPYEKERARFPDKFVESEFVRNGLLQPLCNVMKHIK